MNEIDFEEELCRQFDDISKEKNQFDTNDLVVACIKAMLNSNYENYTTHFEKMKCEGKGDLLLKGNHFRYFLTRA